MLSFHFINIYFKINNLLDDSGKSIDNDSSAKVPKGVEFEHKQEILEGTVGIQSIISNLVDVLDELGKSILCQKNISQLKEELTLLQKKCLLTSEKAYKEVIIQDQAVQLSSEIYVIIQGVEDIVLKTMKLKEEVDESISQEELMSLLCECKKISSSINSHILMQDRMKTPPSSPIMSDNHESNINKEIENAQHYTGASENVDEVQTSEDLLIQEELPNKTELSSSEMNQEDEHFQADEQVYESSQDYPTEEEQGQTITFSKTDELVEEKFSAESLKSSSENISPVEVLEFSGSDINECVQVVDISDQLAVDIMEEDTKGNEKSVGILSTIKGKLSNVFSKSEESVQIDELDPTEIPLAQDLEVEDSKSETGFIASIKNRVGGFFYSQQDSKSETSSSEYFYTKQILTNKWAMPYYLRYPVFS